MGHATQCWYSNQLSFIQIYSFIIVYQLVNVPTTLFINDLPKYGVEHYRCWPRVELHYGGKSTKEPFCAFPKCTDPHLPRPEPEHKSM